MLQSGQINEPNLLACPLKKNHKNDKACASYSSLPTVSITFEQARRN